MSDHREFSRIDFQLHVELRLSDGSEVTGRMIDVSMSGMRILTDQRPVIGAKCEILMDDLDRQLELFAESPTEWVTGVLPNRSGVYRYVIMIRSPADPERRPRPAGGQKDRAPHRTLAKTTAAGWCPRVLELLEREGPMTFNALSVLLVDKTADITGGTPLEEAVWSLVQKRQVAFTLEAPTLFKRLT